MEKLRRPCQIIETAKGVSSAGKNAVAAAGIFSDPTAYHPCQQIPMA